MNNDELKLIMSQELLRRKPVALFAFLEKKHKVTKKLCGSILLELVENEFKTNNNLVKDITTYLHRNSLLEAKES